MEEVTHVLEVLKSVKKALNDKNYLEIKNLSNTVIHQASVDQDADVVSLAVVIYSLSKIIERQEYSRLKNWTGFYKKFILGFDNLIIALEKNDIESLRVNINLIRKNIQKVSGEMKIYISDVFRKAKINKASKIYEHGISMEKTAKILGISIWELAEYAGQSPVQNIDLTVTLPVKQRLKYVEDIFKK